MPSTQSPGLGLARPRAHCAFTGEEETTTKWGKEGTSPSPVSCGGSEQSISIGSRRRSLPQRGRKRQGVSRGTREGPLGRKLRVKAGAEGALGTQVGRGLVSGAACPAATLPSSGAAPRLSFRDHQPQSLGCCWDRPQPRLTVRGCGTEGDPNLAEALSPGAAGAELGACEQGAAGLPRDRAATQ